MGAFLNGSWRSGYRLNGASAERDLFFGDQSTFSLNLFADLSSRPDLLRAHPWLRGSRVQLQAQNLLSAAAAIGRDALVGQPQAFRRRAALPEHVDRNAAARVPVAADPQPAGASSRRAAADGHRAVLVERAVVAEANPGRASAT
jgi:hypothetical protein